MRLHFPRAHDFKAFEVMAYQDSKHEYTLLVFVYIIHLYLKRVAFVPIAQRLPRLELRCLRGKSTIQWLQVTYPNNGEPSG